MMSLYTRHPPPFRALYLGFLLLSLFVSSARAEVDLLIEEPINLLAHISATGHTALMLPQLCSDDHVQFRPCLPGEPGSVISRYQGLATGNDWLAMSPSAYFFAVGTPLEIPSSVTPEQADALRLQYQQANPFHTGVQPDASDWIQLLGQSYRRRIFVLRLSTTPTQDARLMHWLNDDPNRSHFNFMFSNCADFVRRVLNVLFPGAVHRNLFFDAGMTTPKQLASSMHHYAVRHPEVQFSVEVLPQVPGTIPRSGRIRGVTESFVKTTPYLTPLVILNPAPFGGVIASGLLDRRFNPQRLASYAPEYPVTSLFDPQTDVAAEAAVDSSISTPVSTDAALPDQD